MSDKENSLPESLEMTRNRFNEIMKIVFKRAVNGSIDEKTISQIMFKIDKEFTGNEKLIALFLFGKTVQFLKES